MKVRKRNWQSDSGHPVKSATMIKKQVGQKKKAKPGRRSVLRGTPTQARRHIDEVWNEMITYINLTVNTTIQSKLTHNTHILFHSHCSHSL
jgi:hypothetical protein